MQEGDLSQRPCLANEKFQQNLLQRLQATAATSLRMWNLARSEPEAGNGGDCGQIGWGGAKRGQNPQGVVRSDPPVSAATLLSPCRELPVGSAAPAFVTGSATVLCTSMQVPLCRSGRLH